MKLSTYLMIGAFAVGLAACVGVALWVTNLFFRPATTVELSGNSVNQPIENFSSIEFSAQKEGFYYFNSNDRRYSVQNLPATVRIVECDSITQPIISSHPVLDDMITILVENNTLQIEYSPQNMPTTEGEFIKFVNTIEIPVTVTVPRGMLKSINGKRFARFTLQGLNADNLEAEVSQKLIVDNSNIGLLSGTISDALVLRDNSKIKECRLTIPGESLRLKTDESSHFGIVKLVDFSTDINLDIDEASIDEISVNEAVDHQLNSTIRRDVKVTSFTE